MTIKIVPTTLDELDELITYQRSDALPEIFYRFGYQIIHPDTGRPCAGGGVSNTVYIRSGDLPRSGAGGSGPVEIKVDYRAGEPEDL